MSEPRRLPLFDRASQPSSWNERMLPNQYAILYSHQLKDQSTPGPICDTFDTLQQAENYAQKLIAEDPTLRCRIYDHHGLAHPPQLELRGTQHKGEGEITPRFRRWVGSLLFFGGIGLSAIDWFHDFKLTWPATIGMRMAPVGLVLLATEVGIVLTARQKQRRSAQQPATLPAER